MNDGLAPLSRLSVQEFAEKLAGSMTPNSRKLDAGALAERVWKAVRRCTLCRKPSYVFGVYVPDGHADPVVRVGLGKDQSRWYGYGLCVKCFQKDGAAALVEDKIADSMLEEANMRAELDAAGVRYTNESMPDGTRWVRLGDKA